MTQYEEDFYGWTQAMAAHIRDENYHFLDRAHVEEEILSLGQQLVVNLEKELESILFCLLYHEYFEKGGYQKFYRFLPLPRLKARDILEENRSLLPRIPKAMNHAYRMAVLQMRMILPEGMLLPSECPYTFEQCLDDAFYKQDNIQ